MHAVHKSILKIHTNYRDFTKFVETPINKGIARFILNSIIKKSLYENHNIYTNVNGKTQYDVFMNLKVKWVKEVFS